MKQKTDRFRSPPLHDQVHATPKTYICRRCLAPDSGYPPFSTQDREDYREHELAHRICDLAEPFLPKA